MNRISQENRLLFENLVENIRSGSEAAGIAVAIVDAEGNTQYEKFFGYRDAERKLPVNRDTIFGVASVTKSFVALSIMQLYEKGALDLEDPVSRYIPEFTNRNQETVRIRHFLCHSAGFFPVHRTVVKEIAGQCGLSEEKDGDLCYSQTLAEAGTRAVAELLDAQTRENGIIGRPGEYMSYCNNGFGLLSEIVRRVSGEPSFTDYVRKNILAPLGMDRSGCDYLRPRLDENSVVLYRKKNGVMEGTKDFYENAFVLGGAGSMKSTLADLQKLLCMYLNYGRTPDGGRLLSMEGIRTMCRPRIEYRPDSFYCYGLSVKMLDDLKIVEHGGSLPGVSSNISWSYGAGAGVVVLCNTSEVPVAAIADAAMRMYHGRSPQNDRGVYQENPWSEQIRRAACGRYVSGEGNTVEIREKDGDVVVCINGEEKPFFMAQEDLGVVRGAFSDSHVTLYKAEDGHVFAVGFGGRMLPRAQG